MENQSQAVIVDLPNQSQEEEKVVIIPPAGIQSLSFGTTEKKKLKKNLEFHHNFFFSPPPPLLRSTQLPKEKPKGFAAIKAKIKEAQENAKKKQKKKPLSFKELMASLWFLT